MRITNDLNEADKVILFDYSGIAYQAYHSSPSNPEGRFIDICLQAIRSFVQFGDVFTICFAIDSTPTRKLLLYREYKGKRKKTDEDPKEVLLPVLRFFKCLKFKVAGEEADDIIATLCTALREKKKLIVTTDSDLKAMLSRNTQIINPRTAEYVEGDSATALITILEKYMCGDSSDNIPPVRKRIRKEAVKEAIISFINTAGRLVSVREQFVAFLKGYEPIKLSEEEFTQLALNMDLITPRRDIALSPEPAIPAFADYKEFLRTAEEALFDYNLIGVRDCVADQRYPATPNEEVLFGSASQHGPSTPDDTATDVADMLGALDDLFDDEAV